MKAAHEEEAEERSYCETLNGEKVFRDSYWGVDFCNCLEKEHYKEVCFANFESDACTNQGMQKFFEMSFKHHAVCGRAVALHRTWKVLSLYGSGTADEEVAGNEALRECLESPDNTSTVVVVAELFFAVAYVDNSNLNLNTSYHALAEKEYNKLAWASEKNETWTIRKVTKDIKDLVKLIGNDVELKWGKKWGKSKTNQDWTTSTSTTTPTLKK